MDDFSRLSEWKSAVGESVVRFDAAVVSQEEVSDLKIRFDLRVIG